MLRFIQTHHLGLTSGFRACLNIWFLLQHYKNGIFYPGTYKKDTIYWSQPLFSGEWVPNPQKTIPFLDVFTCIQDLKQGSKTSPGLEMANAQLRFLPGFYVLKCVHGSQAWPASRKHCGNARAETCLCKLRQSNHKSPLSSEAQSFGVDAPAAFLEVHA